MRPWHSEASGLRSRSSSLVLILFNVARLYDASSELQLINYTRSFPLFSRNCRVVRFQLDGDGQRFSARPCQVSFIHGSSRFVNLIRNILFTRTVSRYRHTEIKLHGVSRASL